MPTEGLHRTVTQMADGRQLIYFDETAREGRGRPDQRVLEPVGSAAELRYDPLLDEWVSIAAHRQSRTFLPPADECPLCPSTAQRLTEIPDPDYDIVVFENRFPSYSEREGAALTAVLPPLNVVEPARGRCEVICFTAEHDGSFADLSPTRVRAVLDVLSDRTAEIGALPGVEEVFCFENRGVEIGVTLHHPHGQIYGYPFVTPRTRTMTAAASRHRDATGRNLFADLLAAEQAAQERVIATNDHWTAFVPAAARWPVEVILAPHRQHPDLPSLSTVERDDFGPLYLDILRTLDSLHNTNTPAPYISAWRQAPVNADRDLAYLHLQLFSVRRAAGRLKYLAGSESAMGAFLNDALPEETARALRAARGSHLRA
jgi:UDPglucose--hexose-1-phosphate uridylyltransferase